MASPGRYLLRSLLFLLLVIGAAAALSSIAVEAFLHNPVLNGLILIVLLFGVIYSFRRILVLKPERAWIEAYRANKPGFSLQDAPRLLGPVAAALRDHDRRARLTMSASSVSHVLDSIGSRLDESRDIGRYLTGLLIFLGLLGTFWGLLQTIDSVADVIAGLSVQTDDLASMFERMKQGLAAPLDGMGTAFSSSLFGLTGSLILGFLDLQATQAQNAFVAEVEEWLASLTRLADADDGEAKPRPPALAARDFAASDRPLPAYLQAMAQQNGEQIGALQDLMARNERQRDGLVEVFAALNERLAGLERKLDREAGYLQRLVEGQDQLLGFAASAQPEPAAENAPLRAIEARLTGLADELRLGREIATDELRREIRVVAKTIAVAAGEPEMIDEAAGEDARYEQQRRAPAESAAARVARAAEAQRASPRLRETRKPMAPPPRDGDPTSRRR